MRTIKNNVMTLRGKPSSVKFLGTFSTERDARMTLPPILRAQADIFGVTPAPGRPREMKEGRKVTMYLDAASLEAARDLGGGNASEGIRMALRLYASKRKKLLD